MPNPDKKPADEGQVQADAAVSAAGAEQAAAPAADVAAKAADPAEGAPEVPPGVAVMKHKTDPTASAHVDGHDYVADVEGFLVVPLHAVERLVSHGFEMVKKG